MKKRILLSLSLLVLLIAAVIAAILFSSSSSTKKETAQSAHEKTAQSNKNAALLKDLPDAKRSDWELVLVSRDSPQPEMNPDLATVGNIQVDWRIVKSTEQFLAAAQKISPAEHLISGYRSVAYQNTLYEGYIKDEMEGHGTVNTDGSTISREQAIKNVQTYSQPPESSEHNTGLAIDMSDIDSLNESTGAQQVAELAPDYGFVLRFPKDKKSTTGVDYEDWHFRYVGVENAKYMTTHHLTLEEYRSLLPD